MTKEDIRTCPSIDTAKPVSRKKEEEYRNYFRKLSDKIPPIRPATRHRLTTERSQRTHGTKERTTNKEGSTTVSHLRSCNEVIGYHLEGNESFIGKVDDFLVDMEEFFIPYIIIDVGDWFPKKKVIITSIWIENIVWVGRKLKTGIPEEIMKKVTVYDSKRSMVRRYENYLYELFKEL